MRKLLTLILILCTVALFAEMRGGALYDPGAARSNLSNVDVTATPSMTSITLSGKVKAAWADILGDIYASGTAKVATGTAALPAYSFASDSNTGMYSPAADNLAVSVGGVQVATFASTGLGLTSPLTISNGGTGKTTAAEALAALGGASLNGSSTVAFNASTINGVAPLTADEKTQALLFSGFNSTSNRTSPATGTTVITINHGAGVLNYMVVASFLTGGSTNSGTCIMQVGGNAADNDQMKVTTVNKAVTAGVSISDITRVSASEVSFSFTNTVGTSRDLRIFIIGRGGPFTVSYSDS